MMIVLVVLCIIIYVYDKNKKNNVTRKTVSYIYTKYYNITVNHIIIHSSHITYI